MGPLARKQRLYFTLLLFHIERTYIDGSLQDYSKLAAGGKIHFKIYLPQSER